MSLFLLMWLLANGRLAALVSSRGRGFARDPSRPTGRPAARPRQRLRQVRYVATVGTYGSYRYDCGTRYRNLWRPSSGESSHLGHRYLPTTG